MLLRTVPLAEAPGGESADRPPNAFYTEHRKCGHLDEGVDWPVVWIAYPCGASVSAAVDEGDALASKG